VNFLYPYSIISTLVGIIFNYNIYTMNLIEFLKTYTKINNNFIDDFSLYDSKNKYNFSINIDVIEKRSY
jgi:hypothetical protein